VLTPNDKVLAHNGPGTILEPCTLIRLEKLPHPKDPKKIEVWIVVYDSDPTIEQIRAFPCVCDFCNGTIRRI